ncbi:phage integrase N-terminal SAM-like domain-containing protein [Diaphorobacter sp. MNS-0]|nr:phage integrase N-terminal SAM-like domain-containing protein [Diaphorobacter sp. MNS-0]
MDAPSVSCQPAVRQPPRLLESMRERIRVLHYSIRTEQAYVDWARRFILFHDKRHPREMGAPEVTSFLTQLAVERNVSVSMSKGGRGVLSPLDTL